MEVEFEANKVFQISDIGLEGAMRVQFGDLVIQLVDRLLTNSGDLPADIRRAIMKRAASYGGATRDGDKVPEVLAPFVDKVALHAYKTTDDDFARLEAAGYTEDQLFEVTLSAATGAAWARLDRGLAALQGRQ